MERRGMQNGFLGFIFGRQADYIRSLTIPFAICVSVFIFSLVIGYGIGDNISQDVMDDLMGVFPNFENFDITMFILFIVFNNVSKSFLFMILGFVGSFPPLYFNIMNGFIIGIFSYKFSINYGLLITTAFLLPHGIIEIPTILLSSAAGMRLGYQLINRLRGHGGVGVEFVMALRLFVSRIIPLLLLAAIVEVINTILMTILFGIA